MEAGFGYEPSKHDKTWQWLADSEPDVALLQEAIVPGWARSR